MVHYYEFYFASIDDLRRIWSSGSWNLNPGTLRLSRWTLDFNPNRQSHVQCWVRLYDLPQEFWTPKILFEIANAIGTPITLDEATRTRSLGHFARILMEVDMKKRIPYEIMVEV